MNKSKEDENRERLTVVVMGRAGRSEAAWSQGKSSLRNSPLN